MDVALKPLPGTRVWEGRAQTRQAAAVTRLWGADDSPLRCVLSRAVSAWPLSDSEACL